MDREKIKLLQVGDEYEPIGNYEFKEKLWRS